MKRHPRRILKAESLEHNIRYDYSKNPYANLMLFKTDKELNDFVKKNKIKDYDTNINSYGDKVLYFNTSDDTRPFAEKFYRGNEYKYEREFQSEEEAYEFVEENGITKYDIQSDASYGAILYYNTTTEGFNRMRRHILREDSFDDARSLARQKRVNAKRKHAELQKANERITVTYDFDEEEADKYDYIYWIELDGDLNTDVKMDIENEGEDITVEDVSGDSIEYTCPSDFNYEQFNASVVARVLDDALDDYLDNHYVDGEVGDLEGDIDNIISNLEDDYPNSDFERSRYRDVIKCSFNLGDLFSMGVSTWQDTDSTIDDIVRESEYED